MTGKETQHVSQIIDMIMKDFYKMYDKKDVELYYDVAKLEGNNYAG
jgi:hypothetical protein